jgi:hypothetical protein
MALVKKTEIKAVRIRHADHVTLFIPKVGTNFSDKLRSLYFVHGLRAQSYFLLDFFNSVHTLKMVFYDQNTLGF